MLREWQVARLSAEVEAVNAANEICNKIRPVLITHFRKLVGTKIRKLDRSFIKKVEEGLPSLANYCNATIRPELAYKNSLYWHVSAHAFWNYEGEMMNERHEQSICIGATSNNGTLVAVSDEQPPLKCDHKIREVLRLIETAQSVEKTASEAKSACYPFARHI